MIKEFSCDHPKQRIDISPSDSSIYLFHSCHDLDITIRPGTYSGKVWLAALAANSLTVTQVEKVDLELYSDANYNELRNFSGNSLHVATPGNDVKILNGSWAGKGTISVKYAKNVTFFSIPIFMVVVNLNSI